MLKNLLLLCTLITSNGIFCAAAKPTPRIKPPWLYNNTNATVLIYHLPTHGSVGIKPGTFIKKPQWNTNEYPERRTYAKLELNDENHSGWAELRITPEMIKDLESEYVIVFQPGDKRYRWYVEIWPEKEFRDMFAKQLEACPVPGGVQRIIADYCLPAPEKTKKAEEITKIDE